MLVAYNSMKYTGIQADGATNPTFVFNQAQVQQQCDVLLAFSGLTSLGYEVCSLDSGWSIGGNGDANGRIIADSSLFNMTDLANHLDSEGLQLGVYVIPGGFEADVNKTILGTDGDVPYAQEITASLGATGSTERMEFNSGIILGVNFIKFDFIIPGSPQNGATLPANKSLAVVAYHNAISQSERQMRLDISWKLTRDPSDFEIWETNADSFRTDQDINNAGDDSFTVIPPRTTHRITTGMAIPTNSEAHSVADFATQNPMRPRNPGTGLGDAQQLQAWIGGPNSTGNAFVILVNYGTSIAGVQNVTVFWSDLGISGSFGVRDVWQG
ncbi:hypothetical protein BDP27DRAFT_1419111 [Rhodocollybia butyracea]|uniref:alpha-galactosidase n=1 Tax=Rhodocollybia butyracea TaxID=206335 RepID=A0A9P5UAQ2_9AGAR|nr:hypothetical protein BDP27DRAFT_1419111 [Rhodocollybia butyracea]